MITTYKAAPDIDVLTTNFPIPGLGQLAINSFVLHGDVPVLVDTGPVVERESFMTALKSVIDPVDLRWIWLTHTDGDHIGALGQLLAEYPDLKVITTFLGVGIMSVSDPLPMDRVHLVNPGQTFTPGSRTLTAFRPPTFDNPSTTGFFDTSSGVLFPADCFGALLQDVPQNAADLSEGDLREGQVFWATIDSAWMRTSDAASKSGVQTLFAPLAELRISPCGFHEVRIRVPLVKASIGSTDQRSPLGARPRPSREPPRMRGSCPHAAGARTPPPPGSSSGPR